MQIRPLPRAGALVALMLLVGASLASALPLTPTPGPTTEVETTSSPDMLGALWGGLLELVGVERALTSDNPASPPASPSGGEEISTLDSADATSTTSDDEDRNAGLDPNG